MVCSGVDRADVGDGVDDLTCNGDDVGGVSVAADGGQ